MAAYDSVHPKAQGWPIWIVNHHFNEFGEILLVGAKKMGMLKMPWGKRFFEQR